MTSSAEAPDPIAPLYLVEHTDDDGPRAADAWRWSLCLSDSDSPVEVFEEVGHTGSGYAWDSVARIAMASLTQSHREAIEFDSEAGTFVAVSALAEPLIALGTELAKLLRDDEALRRAIRAVPEEDWDD